MQKVKQIQLTLHSPCIHRPLLLRASHSVPSAALPKYCTSFSGVVDSQYKLQLLSEQQILELIFSFVIFRSLNRSLFYTEALIYFFQIFSFDPLSPKTKLEINFSNTLLQLLKHQNFNKSLKNFIFNTSLIFYFQLLFLLDPHQSLRQGLYVTNKVIFRVHIVSKVYVQVVMKL